MPAKGQKGYRAVLGGGQTGRPFWETGDTIYSSKRRTGATSLQGLSLEKRVCTCSKQPCFFTETTLPSNERTKSKMRYIRSETEHRSDKESHAMTSVPSGCPHLPRVPASTPWPDLLLLCHCRSGRSTAPTQMQHCRLRFR